MHDRRTCLTYENGFFDRFERKFLGFAQVAIVEGCTTIYSERKAVQLDVASANGVHVGAVVSASRDSEQLAGIRRIDRVYANRSIYEAGLLLTELAKDISVSRLVAGAGSPTRTIENTYSLLDVGTSTAEHRNCFALNTANATAAASGGRSVMRAVLSKDNAGRIATPTQCGDLPAFDRDPRRLTPILLQSMQSTTELDATTLMTAVQFDVDHRARIKRVCDLGNLADHDDDLCANYRYDDFIQLSFIHGATGGGTLAFDRRDRVKEIVIRAGGEEKSTPVRRRSATYNPTNGDLLVQCQFERLDLRADPCASVPSNHLNVQDLQSNHRERVAVRQYHYDLFGNIDHYVSPTAADGHHLSRTIEFDPFLHLVELGEKTDYCRTGAAKLGSDSCLLGSGSALGTFVSHQGDVDWRHAVATTQVDINRNVIHTMLDGLGRPIKVFASWAGSWAEKADCSKGECSSLSTDVFKPNTILEKLVDYAYQVGPNLDPSTSLARTTRYADASLYKVTGQDERSTGRISFDTDQHFDQLGRLVRTISPADICIPERETVNGAACDPGKRATHIATGITTSDAANRQVDSYLPVGVQWLVAVSNRTCGPATR